MENENDEEKFKPHAKEANEKAHNYLKLKDEGEINKIFKLIESAAQEGMFYIEINHKIQPHAFRVVQNNKKVFEEREYEVKENGETIEIKW